MRVFVAGASGAIGTRLVPQLVERGHEVIGTSLEDIAAALRVAMDADEMFERAGADLLWGVTRADR
jgi:2-alkyl-3-oxoalkanoate reductase